MEVIATGRPQRVIDEDGAELYRRLSRTGRRFRHD